MILIFTLDLIYQHYWILNEYFKWLVKNWLIHCLNKSITYEQNWILSLISWVYIPYEISVITCFSKFLVNFPFDYKVYHKMCPVNSWKNILASDMLLHLCMSLFQLWNEITFKSNLGSLNLCFFFLLCYFLCLAWSFCIWHFTGLSSTRAPRVNWTGDFTHFKHRL